MNFSTQTWTIPAPKTKTNRANTIPLSSHALALLIQLRGKSYLPEGYVFGSRKGTPVSHFSRAKRTLDGCIKKIAEQKSCKNLSDWNVHDLRRTFVTILADLGVSNEVREKYVNHMSGALGGVVGIYTHSSFKQQQIEAIDKFDQFVSNLFGISSNVSSTKLLAA